MPAIVAVNFALLFTTLHALFVLLQTAFIISNIIHGLSLRQISLSEKLEFTHRVLGIDRPTIFTNSGVVAQYLLALDVTAVAPPTN